MNSSNEQPENPFEFHSDGSENDRKTTTVKKIVSYGIYGFLCLLVLHPPVVGTIVALRFEGNLLWIERDILSDLYISVVATTFILLVLVFPIVIRAIRKKNFLSAFIVVASLIYSWCIFLIYGKAIT